MMPVTMRLGPIVFAHRGGSEEAPENTMSAFAYAYEAGIRHVETDAHVTADGKVVICHDETVDRCYDGTGVIAQMTWRELSKLRHRDSGEQMPLLAQVLEAFPDMYFNIDAKEPGVEGPLLDVIADHGAADRVLERVGLADRADDYPRQLSGGQRQRVAIVRALMMDPEILLLDEVTASLDPEMVREVLDVVLELARTGMTMLIVTHEMGFARAIADRIVFMDEGRIVEVDPPRKFFADPSSDRARKFLDIFSFEGAKL